ncbi:PKD domain-containing protein [Nocardioides kongjuensis]|uniref:PKD domain-containing protein n=1 Tax=Nocardioides kongjuensis TaxID=349522 RepID=A0A852R9A2_9ACTN|nr:hypothetical protein [Nocardioides kongjuensis]NYD30161.1 hypothetical protein [Nocardioides kongjuensis]
MAVADDDTGTGTSGAGFWIQKVHHGQNGHSDSGHAVRGDEAKSQPVLIGNGACSAADPVAGEFLDASFCSSDEKPVITVADVQKAFAELPLSAGALVIQPPDGLTLVNFKTNFYTTTTTPTTATVTLLGQPVTLEATPATYTWHFGDGDSTSTTEPGAPYPKLTVTHSYKLKGDYQPSLSTTYTGRYKLADGPWQSIPGTVTIDGPPQPLRAIEAEPKLVGY